MWQGNRVAYICAVYFGRPEAYDGAHNRVNHIHARCHADAYLAALRRHATCLDKVILVCSLNPGHEEFFHALKDKALVFEQESGIPVVVCSKQDPGHWSYGGWNLALQQHCEDIDFAFLVEDDYFPVMPGFDEELLSYSYSTGVDRESVLVCVGHWNAESVYGPHAACSIGLINVDLFKKYGGTFTLPPGEEHNGPHTQVNYLNAFINKGLSIRSMSADYCLPFMAANVTSSLVYLDNSPMLRPLVFAPAELPADVIAGHHAQLPGPGELSTRERDSGGFHILGGA
jgi:hypothetical protein